MAPVARFEDALEVTPLEDGRNWCVEHPFYYDTLVALTPLISARFILPRWGGFRVVVPVGFTTDFASIPRIVWNVLPPFGKYTKAAVVHDLLYRAKGCATRSQADSVLLEAMKICQVPWWQRAIIYAGVRVGGWASYKGGL